ncbi:MAG: type II toxin-antitoxin system VapB family antitoxin [Chloroflexota bacterium]|nr:type II toxin-antitoxin system VapB family antitoxin [Chloroflexota bacterium]MDE2894728.1 type II toxin-antitoxin system VapB family antitoxin [Chloroflexota bacterium]
MPLTIENEETCRLLIELGELTGASPEEALATAVNLAVEREREIQATIGRIGAIASKARSLAEAQGTQLMTTEEMNEFLYDENGQPH